VDAKFLPGKKWEYIWDPEGLLSTLPAIGTCLLGVLAGLFLKNGGSNEKRKVAWLLAAGTIGVMAGFAWGTQFPVVKKIWTSSFVLVAGGYSVMLLGIFYFLVDVLRWQRWCQPLVWYGMNPITVYLADNIVGFRKLASRVLGGDVQAYLNMRAEGLGDLMLSFGEIGVGLLLVWWLYRRKIFLRL
jgi:predicted acyltransferase